MNDEHRFDDIAKRLILRALAMYQLIDSSLITSSFITHRLITASFIVHHSPCATQKSVKRINSCTKRFESGLVFGVEAIQVGAVEVEGRVEAALLENRDDDFRVRVFVEEQRREVGGIGRPIPLSLQEGPERLAERLVELRLHRRHGGIGDKSGLSAMEETSTTDARSG